MRTKIYLPMAALIVTAALAFPASAQQEVPFKGTFQGSDAVNPPTLATTGTGVGTHLGKFTLTKQMTFSTLSGSANWVTANGDTIDSTFTASADVSTRPLGYITITETHTITAGTGQFAGAQGSFILERTHLTTPSADGTHVTFGSFHGSITSPATAH